MCRVSQCCCGCSLETGCKILAILGLIFGGIGLIQGVIGLVVEASTILKVISNAFYIIASALLLYGALYVRHVIFCVQYKLFIGYPFVPEET